MRIINDLAERYPKVPGCARRSTRSRRRASTGATRSGVTVAIADVATPPGKPEILVPLREAAAKVEKQFARGVITDDERRQELIEIWKKATREVAKEMQKNFPKYNPIKMMVESGAGGNMPQVQQLAGIRGLVANPKGEIIPRPIKTNFRDGPSCWSTSSPWTVPVKVWPTPLFVPPTPVT